MKESVLDMVLEMEKVSRKLVKSEIKAWASLFNTIPTLVFNFENVPGQRETLNNWGN